MEAAINDIKYLRGKTEAGMQDCRRALAEAEGDREAAERLLKEWGLAGRAEARGQGSEGRRCLHPRGGRLGRHGGARL